MLSSWTLVTSEQLGTYIHLQSATQHEQQQKVSFVFLVMVMWLQLVTEVMIVPSAAASWLSQLQVMSLIIQNHPALENKVLRISVHHHLRNTD